MGDTLIASDENAKHYPNLNLAQVLYRLGSGGDSSAAAEVLAAIEADEMGPFYSKCCEKFGWALDEAKLAAMTAANAKSLEEIENKTLEAVTNAGDTEVLDLMFVKAQHFCKIGGWADAFAAYDAILAKEKTSTGKKIDATMAKTRIALFDLVGRPRFATSSSSCLYSLTLHPPTPPAPLGLAKDQGVD